MGIEELVTEMLTRLLSNGPFTASAEAHAHCDGSSQQGHQGRVGARIEVS